MQKHLEHELVELRQLLFKMSDTTLDAMHLAVKSVRDLDTSLAKEVTKGDKKIDQIEKEIDELCVRMLVTQQPAAGDLRFILCALKINTDIERIADLACTIARQTKKLVDQKAIKPLIDIPRMAEICDEMLKKALKSISDRNVKLAVEVLDQDCQLNELDQQIYRELLSYMAESPSTIPAALSIIKVSKSLERIGDHIKNIAERSIYFTSGEDVRHSKDLLKECRESE